MVSLHAHDDLRVWTCRFGPNMYCRNSSTPATRPHYQ